MKPFSITAPEEIAKEYGGNKKKIQQAAAQGLIDPTSAVLAGMFVDRIRGAAQAEQAQQPTVAAQVMNPQPQMPPQGMAAMPQAQQMPPQAQMGRPQAPQMQQPMPRQMAMGGGLDAIPYNEGSYAPGGVVSFQVGGGYGETMAQLRQQLAGARTQAQRDQIQRAMSQLTAQYQQSTFEPNMSTGPAREGLAAVDTSDPMAIGMETFADNTPAQSQRIDPNRFSTGTLTEAEARRIEGDNGGLLSAFGNFIDRANSQSGIGQIQEQNRRLAAENVIPDAYTGATVAADPLVSAVEQGKQVASTGTPAGLASTQEARDFGVDAVPLTAAQQEMQDNVMRMSERRANASLIPDWLKGRRFQDQDTDRMPTREEVRADFEAKQTAATQDLSNVGVEQPEDQSVFGDRAATTQVAPEGQTIAEQVEQANKSTEALKPKTVEQDDPDAAETALKAANDQANAMTEAAKTTAADDFQKQIEELMDPAEKGEFRKEMEALVKNRGDRLKSAKKEAFSMALLQAGLGMLGQGGGQTALQALGKSALPATKQYAASIKDAKKEDRELLQLGLSLEQMDAKELAATKRAVAQLYGKRSAAMLQAATSQANNIRTTATSQYVADVGAESRVEAAEIAAQAQKDVTGALKTSELLRKLSADRVGVVEAIDTIRSNELMQPGPGLTYYQARAAFQKDATEENAAKAAAAKKLFDEHVRGLTSEYRDILEQNTAMQGQLSQSLMPSGGTGGFTVKRVN